MKKFCIFFLLSCILIVTATLGTACSYPVTTEERFLRIHIRADSNDAEAQAVKYAVRDGVVEYLTPIICEAQSFANAAAVLEEELDGVTAVANGVLKGQGFDYNAKATLKREQFPTRKYGEYTLEEGEYLALIIELGSGKGQNWWCVIYPPLCFAGQTNTPVVYKSKILEIIERWKQRTP